MQLELDFTRPDRSSQMIEAALLECGAGPVQRALLRMMVLHPGSVKADDGLQTLKISSRSAARWMNEELGITCVDSAVRKALQWWVDQGVVIAIPERSGTVIKTHWQRVYDWYDLRSEPVEQPIFAPLGGQQPGQFAPIGGVESLHEETPPVVNGGESRAPVSTGGESRAPVVKGGESLINQTNKDLSSFDSTEPASASVQASGRNLSFLPDVPRDVWTAGDDREVLRCLEEWTSLSGQPEGVLASVFGLVLQTRETIGRKGGDHDRYFATARGKVAPFVVTRGQRRLSELRVADETAASLTAAAETEEAEKQAEAERLRDELVDLRERHSAYLDSLSHDELIALLPRIPRQAALKFLDGVDWRHCRHGTLSELTFLRAAEGRKEPVG